MTFKTWKNLSDALHESINVANVFKSSALNTHIEKKHFSLFAFRTQTTTLLYRNFLNPEQHLNDKLLLDEKKVYQNILLRTGILDVFTF